MFSCWACYLLLLLSLLPASCYSLMWRNFMILFTLHAFLTFRTFRTFHNFLTFLFTLSSPSHIVLAVFFNLFSIGSWSWISVSSKATADSHESLNCATFCWWLHSNEWSQFIAVKMEDKHLTVFYSVFVWSFYSVVAFVCWCDFQQSRNHPFLVAA